jgi:3-oxoacyl-[acyl-carrier protein] reductase
VPSVLITGASRRQGIAAACALKLARIGWDVGISGWQPYDHELDPASIPDPDGLLAELRGHGVRAELAEVDLSDPAGPGRLFDELEARVGTFTALVAAHARDIQLPLSATSADEFDRHFAVNARSVALLIQEFAHRLVGNDGRIVAFTSDALNDNVPYGVSKGALDRIIKAAALELGPRGIRANCVNPGPSETGWISAELRAEISRASPLGRPSVPEDSANLVAFLLSEDGAWISGQLLYSNGGLQH